jgi:Zn ribbon nucleic-acid-binding protein
MYWDCPRCSAENPLEATRCGNCGYQYFPGYGRGAPPREGSRQLRESLEKDRQSIQEDIRKGVEGALERSRATLDRLAGGSPEPAPAGTGPAPTDRKDDPGSETAPSKGEGRPAR